MTAKSPDPLLPLRHFEPRDLLLLTWLDEHQVLTTRQIATALFPSLRSAQRRLLTLDSIGAVARFTFGRTISGGEMRYTLGPLGAEFRRGETARSLRTRRFALSRNPRLPHLLGVNGFFTDLHGHTRTHPGTQLRRWWSEQQASNTYMLAGVHPDGHGIWHADDTTVGFFLEHDRGTEDYPRLLHKLTGYQRLAVAGPRYPILFHLTTRTREDGLHQQLTDEPPHVAVATCVHGDDPATAVWWLARTDGQRRHLHQLPSDHGPEGISNPERYREPT
jgi:hypothetical protein